VYINSIHPSIHLYIHSSIHPSIHLSIHLYIHPSIQVKDLSCLPVSSLHRIRSTLSWGSLSGPVSDLQGWGGPWGRALLLGCSCPAPWSLPGIRYRRWCGWTDHRSAWATPETHRERELLLCSVCVCVCLFLISGCSCSLLVAQSCAHSRIKHCSCGYKNRNQHYEVSVCTKDKMILFSVGWCL